MQKDSTVAQCRFLIVGSYVFCQVALLQYFVTFEIMRCSFFSSHLSCLTSVLFPSAVSLPHSPLKTNFADNFVRTLSLSLSLPLLSFTTTHVPCFSFSFLIYYISILKTDFNFYTTKNDQSVYFILF